MKYNEDKILKEVLEYIKTTYSKHYSTTKEGFQVQDILRHLKIDKDFSLSNAIKYLMRYGKKDGKKLMDLFNAIHHIVLLTKNVLTNLRKLFSLLNKNILMKNVSPKQE
jgi:hypothetical protein